MRRLIKRIWLRFFGTMVAVETDVPVVALTFDDGPHPVYTPEVLKVLSAYGAHATFFMVGEPAKRYPEIVRQVAEAGHAIGNHTYEHAVLPLLSGPQRRKQLRDCAQALAPYKTRLFRPPYGGQSRRTRMEVALLRYRPVAWNVVAEDWLEHEPEWMAQHVIEQIQPGSIVLFHDAIFRSMQEHPQYNRKPTVTALALLLEWARDRYRCVTVPELLRYGRPVVQDWISIPPREYLNRLDQNRVETAVDC
jgi:peptidoglycan-N-acetylglucosamine deacetylase